MDRTGADLLFLLFSMSELAWGSKISFFFFFLQTCVKLRSSVSGFFVLLLLVGFCFDAGLLFCLFFFSVPYEYAFSNCTAWNSKELTSHVRSQTSHLLRRKHPRLSGRFRSPLLASSDGILLKINKGSPGEWAKFEHLMALKDKELKASLKKELSAQVLALRFMSPDSVRCQLLGPLPKKHWKASFPLISLVCQQLMDTFCEARPIFNTFQSTGMNSPLSSHNGKTAKLV